MSATEKATIGNTTPTSAVGEGNGSYAFDPAGTGSYYVIERKEAVIGELGHHTITAP